MVQGVWGRKLGMSQRFVGDKIIPVTAITVDNWVITNVRTVERDGYRAIQIGQIKKRYMQSNFSLEWIKQIKKYFSAIKEIKVSGDLDLFQIGTPFEMNSVAWNVGDRVNATGITKGAGFQGAVKRHGFTGGPKTHGDDLGRAPGSGGSVRRDGKIFKGKRFPGHMGVEKQTMQNLEIVSCVDNLLLVKGSVPGKARSLIFVGTI